MSITGPGTITAASIAAVNNMDNQLNTLNEELGTGDAAQTYSGLGSQAGVVEKSGAWFSYDGTRIGQGRENAKQFLKDNVDMRKTIDVDLRKALGMIRTEAPAAPAPAPPPAAPPAAARARG